MKRGLFGIGLLGVLLAAAVIFSFWIPRTLAPVCHDLSMAREEALGDRWETARDSWWRARAGWADSRPLVDKTADKGYLEDIESLLSRGDVTLRTREKAEFAATCAELEQRIRAVGDAHR